LPGSGKFALQRSGQKFEKMIFFMALADGPAFASQVPAEALPPRRQRRVAHHGAGHVSVSQFNEQSLRLSAVALAAGFASQQHVHAVRSVVGADRGASRKR
jgi:hypothetical protein